MRNVIVIFFTLLAIILLTYTGYHFGQESVQQMAPDTIIVKIPIKVDPPAVIKRNLPKAVISPVKEPVKAPQVLEPADTACFFAKYTWSVNTDSTRIYGHVIASGLAEVGVDSLWVKPPIFETTDTLSILVPGKEKTPYWKDVSLLALSILALAETLYLIFN